MAPPLLSYNEAAEQVQLFIEARSEATADPSFPEIVPLSAAASRVLAEPIRSDRDQPPFPRSTRDGFACRAGDLASGQALKVTGSIRAGEAGAQPVGAGE